MIPTTMQNDFRAYVLQPDEGQNLASLRVRLLATQALTHGVCCALEIVNPGPGGPPLHTHHAHDEFYFVLKGRYRFRIGEREHEGGPGTFAYVARNEIHAFASVGPEEGRLFSASLPGGLEHFLERLADLQERGVELEEIEALHAEYDTEVNGPPLVITDRNVVRGRSSVPR